VKKAMLINCNSFLQKLSGLFSEMK